MFKKVGPIDVHLKKLLNDEFLEDRHGNDFSTSNVKESEAFHTLRQWPKHRRPINDQSLPKQAHVKTTQVHVKGNSTRSTAMAAYCQSEHISSLPTGQSKCTVAPVNLGGGVSISFCIIVLHLFPLPI